MSELRGILEGMSRPFKVGDLVTLKSGSPLMTVEALRENDIIGCVYYNGNVRHNEDHPTGVLELYVDRSNEPVWRR